MPFNPFCSTTTACFFSFDPATSSFISMYKTKTDEHATQQVDLCRRLREAIILGHLEHGQRITEKFISEMMDVKRGPARESLLILEGQGLVRKVPSLGYFVESNSDDEIRDVYAVRVALETIAIRRAAENATREDLVRLQLICEAMRATVERGDTAERVREDLNFHAEIVHASGSRVLQRAYSTLPRPFYGPTELPSKKATRVMQQHEAIFKAISEHDPDRAAEMLALHISEHDKSANNGHDAAKVG